jgi:hypothetical protein
LERIDNIIKSEFSVISVDDKIQGPVDSFGYMSIHYIVTMKDSLAGPRYDRVKGVRFEIQVRTISMHAWAVISHYLDYKGDWDVPDNLKKSLNALSGLFYIADGQFEQFYQESQRSRDSATRRQPNREINFDTMGALLTEVYPKRDESGPHHISEFVKEAKEIGFQNIDEVKSLLLRANAAVEAIEKELGTINYYAMVGAARIAFGVAAEQSVYRKKAPAKWRALYEKFRPLVKPT